MALKQTTCFLAIGFATVSLYGCGGGSDDDGADDKPSEEPKPKTGAEIVNSLNSMYMGFDESDDSSPLGVVIQMHEDFQFYCKPFGTSCYMGHSDCIVSTSIYNHKLMLNHETNGVQITMDRLTGIIFDSTSVFSKLGKCSYQFDGATFNRLNGGCGCGAGPADCEDENSAYFNKDPQTNQSATGSSPTVKGCHCESYRSDQPNQTTQEQCYWKGAAFYQNEGMDETRKMLKQRLANQAGTEEVEGEGTRYKQEYWNEIVIDGNVLYDELKANAFAAVPAILFVKTTDPVQTANAKKLAQELAATMSKQYKLSAIAPVIGIDPSIAVTQGAGPFFFEESSEESVTV